MARCDTEPKAQLLKSSSILGSLSEVSHRGAVDVAGCVQSVCSTEFLLTLAMEFIKTRAYSMVIVVAEVKDEEQIARLRFLIRELQRLIEYPRLFRTANIKARFFALLGADSRVQFGKACTNLLLEAEMRKIMRSSHKNETRKSYVDGSRNWENFLFDGAPGTLYRVTQTIPKSVFQVIPAVGMRIVADFEREEAEIVRFVEQSQVPLDVKTAKTTLLVNFDKPTPREEVIPEIKLPQQGQTTAIQPNPFAEHLRIRLSLTTSAATPLEEFSSLINRLEQPPPPPQAPVQVLNAPNVFPVFALRSWQPPTKLQDLRFMR